MPTSPAPMQKLVINQSSRQGQPGSQITVPLATLQALQAGQGIPTGQPGHLLVKTENGQYQILRVGMGPPGPQGPGPGQPHQTIVPVSSIATSNAAPSMPVSLSSQAPLSLPQVPVTGPMTARLPNQPAPMTGTVVRQTLSSGPLVAAVRNPLPTTGMRGMTPGVVTATAASSPTTAITQPTPAASNS